MVIVITQIFADYYFCLFTFIFYLFNVAVPI